MASESRIKCHLICPDLVRWHNFRKEIQIHNVTVRPSLYYTELICKFKSLKQLTDYKTSTIISKTVWWYIEPNYAISSAKRPPMLKTKWWAVLYLNWIKRTSHKSNHFWSSSNYNVLFSKYSVIACIMQVYRFRKLKWVLYWVVFKFSVIKRHYFRSFPGADNKKWLATHA